MWNAEQNKYGFDYYSLHFMKDGLGSVKRLIVGDYQLQFGQGLVLGAGFNPGGGDLRPGVPGGGGLRPADPGGGGFSAVVGATT